MRNFFYSVVRSPVKPSAIFLVNDGVRLACDDSEIINSLRILSEENDVEIKVCGTCLDRMELTNKLAVGEIGTMPDTVAALFDDEEIVTIA